MGITERPLGNASQEKALQAGSAVAPHDDHSGAQFLGLSGDNVGEVHSASDHETAILPLELLALHQFVKFCPCIVLQEPVKVKLAGGGRIDQLDGHHMQGDDFPFFFTCQRKRIVKRSLGTAGKIHGHKKNI